MYREKLIKQKIILFGSYGSVGLIGSSLAFAQAAAPVPSVNEHSDLMQYLILGLIIFTGYMLRKWDTNHEARQVEIIAAITGLNDRLVSMGRDFYTLKGEHLARHRRETDPPDTHWMSEGSMIHMKDGCRKEEE